MPNSLEIGVYSQLGQNPTAEFDKKVPPPKKIGVPYSTVHRPGWVSISLIFIIVHTGNMVASFAYTLVSFLVLVLCCKKDPI